MYWKGDGHETYGPDRRAGNSVPGGLRTFGPLPTPRRPDRTPLAPLRERHEPERGTARLRKHTRSTTVEPRRRGRPGLRGLRHHRLRPGRAALRERRRAGGGWRQHHDTLGEPNGGER